MGYEAFKSRVSKLLAKVGGITADFVSDEERGRFFANCSDGTTIIGNSKSMKVTVKWGSGHTAMATI